MAEVLTCRDLSIGYVHGNSSRLVQKGLTVSIESSEFVSLLGPNGCGKSTLLRSLCGLQPLLDGEVLIEGKPLQHYSLAQRARRFAIVLSDNVSIDGCTVREMVAMGRYPYLGRFGNLTDSDEKAIDEAMRAVSVQAMADRHLSHLSDGERQRVMIAKALAQDTPLIFLDEPTSHLDLTNRVEVMLLLRNLAHDLHRSILLSTHELELSLRLSDRIWLMQPSLGGLQYGTPQELLSGGVIQRMFNHPDFSITVDGSVRVNKETER